MNARTLVVVPMKDPKRSKARLASVLSPLDRAVFARVLLKRTLAFLADLGADVAVVTASAEAAQIAQAAGVEVIPEGTARGLNAALTTAAAHAAARGYARLLILPADLAAPDLDDIRAVLARPEPVVICPAVDGGTNALLLSPAQVIPFHFGPKSATRHSRAARARGLTPALLPLESLRFDIDHADGLAQALTLAPDLAQSLGAAS